MSYYDKLPLIRMPESINKTEFAKYKILAAKIFDAVIMISLEGNHGDIFRSKGIQLYARSITNDCRNHPSLRSICTEPGKEFSRSIRNCKIPEANLFPICKKNIAWNNNMQFN